MRGFCLRGGSGSTDELGAGDDWAGGRVEGEEVEAGYAVAEEDQAGYLRADAEGGRDRDRAGAAGRGFGAVGEYAGGEEEGADRDVAATLQAPLEHCFGR